MNRLFALAAVLLGCSLPLLAAEEKKTSAPSRELEGRLLNLEGSTKNLTLRAQYTEFVPNVGYRRGADSPAAVKHLIAEQNRLQREYVAAMKTRNPVQRSIRLQRLNARIQHDQMAANSKYAKYLAYHSAVRHQDVKLHAANDVVVRVANPPDQFDDNGKPKKLGPADLKKLKGDPKLWGYPGDYTDLKNGQAVHVFVSYPKSGPNSSKKDENGDLPEDSKPAVTMIYILGDQPKK